MWYERRLVFLRQTIKFDPIFWRHSRSRSRSFPGITTSHSRSRKLGMEFVIPVPVPKNWEWNLSFPFPFPKVGNAIFHSRSQNLGMGWAIPVPVPKVKKPFPLTPAPRGPKSVIFDTIDLDPLYFEVGIFLGPPDPPYMSKNAQMCYF